jgi:dTDP-D-glucose 4,6-dehydratase
MEVTIFNEIKSKAQASMNGVFIPKFTKGFESRYPNVLNKQHFIEKITPKTITTYTFGYSSALKTVRITARNIENYIFVSEDEISAYKKLYDSFKGNLVYECVGTWNGNWHHILSCHYDLLSSDEQFQYKVQDRHTSGDDRYGILYRGWDDPRTGSIRLTREDLDGFK